MCQECVSQGTMTQRELDEAIAAGDRSVVPYVQRIAEGESAEALLADLAPIAALLGYSSIETMLDAIQRARTARMN